MRRAGILVLLLLACARKKVEVSADDAAPRAIPNGFEYARSTTGHEIDSRGALVVWLGRDGLRLGSEPLLIPLRAEASKGFSADYKSSGELDLRLPKLLDAVHGPTRAIVHVDRRVPYRPLTEVLFTLGLAKVDRWTFVTEGLRGIELFAPNPNKGPRPIGLGGAGVTMPLAFTVLVVSEGFVVKALGATLDADCRAPGKGVTIAKDDFAGLTRCAITAKDAAALYTAERACTVSANPDTQFQTVLSTWDAMRRRPDGTDLLPDIALAVAR